MYTLYKDKLLTALLSFQKMNVQKEVERDDGDFMY